MKRGFMTKMTLGILKLELPMANDAEKNAKTFDKAHTLKFIVKICHIRRMHINYLKQNLQKHLEKAEQRMKVCFLASEYENVVKK